jgi:hypothetical protein
MAQGQNNLALFLNAVINDPQKWAQFRKEPQQMMQAAGLTAQEQQLLSVGPIDELRKYVGAAATQFGAYMIW